MNFGSKQKFVLFFCLLTMVKMQGIGVSQGKAALHAFGSKVSQTSAEDNLRAIANKFESNILVDSSNLPESIVPEAIDSKARGPEDNVVNVLVSNAQSYHLSTKQINPQTFLFWPEADLHRFAEGVAKGGGFGAERDQVLPVDVSQKLFDYFYPEGIKNTPEDQATDPKANVRGRLRSRPMTLHEFELTQLPQDLQSQVAALILSNGGGYKPRDYAELWLRPDVWKKSRIIYSPEDPTIGGSYRTLVAQCVLQTPQGRFLLSLDTYKGWSMTKSIRSNTTQIPIDNPNGKTTAEVLQVFTIDEAETDNKSLIVNNVLRPAGSAWKSWQNETLKISLQEEKGLSEKVSIEAKRQSLREFLAAVGQITRINLQLPAETHKENLLISASTREMPLSDLMTSLATLYGRKWVKNGEAAYSLEAINRSEVETDLLEVGYLPWYKFREINVSARKQQKTDFDQLAARVFEAGGDKIQTPAGIPVSDLPEELQKEIQARSVKEIERQIVSSQIMSRDLLDGKWSFQLGVPSDTEIQGMMPRRPYELRLLVNGRPRNMISLPAPPVKAQQAQ